VAGESALWVDPAEVPADGDIGKLGRALAAGRHGKRDELMASTAAYSGLRWGELTALTIAQIDITARVITVDRKVVEVALTFAMMDVSRSSGMSIVYRETIFLP
jgi:integrase